MILILWFRHLDVPYVYHMWMCALSSTGSSVFVYYISLQINFGMLDLYKKNQNIFNSE